jgi:hypothetical protein
MSASDGASSPGAVTRTMPPDKLPANAALKVASPQRVGGWVLRNPYLVAMGCPAFQE